jgi:hypothetical protein
MKVLPDSETLLEYVLGQTAPGAWPVGTLVRKGPARDGDLHAEGALATVRGSVGPIAHEGNPRVYAYLLEFADVPEAYVLVHDGDGRLVRVKG